MSSLPLSLVGLTAQVALLAFAVCVIHQLTNRNINRQSTNLLFAGVFGCLVLTVLIFAPLPSWFDFRPKNSVPAANSMLVSKILSEEPVRNEEQPATTEDNSTKMISTESSAPPMSRIGRRPAKSIEAIHNGPASPLLWFSQPQISRWFSIVFGAAAVLALIRLANAIWSLYVAIRDSQLIEDESINRRFFDVGQRMGLSGHVSLRTSPAVDTAATIGWRKPVVLLCDQYSCWTSSQLSDVFAHELAHVKHNDFFKHCVCQLVTAVHFCNPFVHWLARRFSFSQELAADQAASDLNPYTYSRTLAELALSRQGNPRIALGLFNRHALISERIAMLQNRTSLDSRRFSSGLSLIVIVAIVLTGLRMPSQASMKNQAPPAINLATDSLASPLPDRAASAVPSSPQESSGDDNFPWQELKYVKPDNFTLTVLDQDTEQPIPATSIVVWGIDRANSDLYETLMEVQTDEQGRFRFQDLQARFPTTDRRELGSEIVIGIKKEGYATHVVRPANLVAYLENPSAFSISLPVAEGLDGRVVDESGNPVVGAKVWKHIFIDKPIEGFYAVTDETGRFRIKDSNAFRERWVSKDSVIGTSFVVEHPEFGQSRGTITFRPPNEGLIQLKLSRVFSVTGRVVGSSRPSGCKIRVYPVNASTRRSNSKDEFIFTEPISRVTTLNEQEEFSFWLPSGDEYYLVPIDPNRELGASAVKVTGGPGQSVNLPEIEIKPMVEVEGYVIDSESKERVAFDDDQEVSLMWHGEDYPKGISPVRSVAIDRNGSFKAKMVPGQNFPYIATVTKGQRYSSNNHFENGIIVKPGETDSLIMELKVFEHNNPRWPH